MEKRIYPEPIESVVSPEPFARKSFTDAGEAIAALQTLYNRVNRIDDESRLCPHCGKPVDEAAAEGQGKRLGEFSATPSLN